MMRPKGSAMNDPPQNSQTRAFDAIAANVAMLFADAVDGADVDSVGDGVGALDGLPGIILRRAKLFLLGRMPADRGGIEEHVRALHGGDARTFRIPLVPADEGADLADGGVERLEAEIAGGEVKLLVIERVVGDVHLAIEPGEGAVFVQDGGGVVIKPGRAALKERGDDDDFFFAGDCAEAFGAGTGDGLGEIEERGVFALAEILRAKELGQADDVRAFAGGFADFVGGLIEIGIGIGAAGHLDQADAVVQIGWHVA